MAWPADTSVQQSLFDALVARLKLIDGVSYKEDVDNRVFLFDDELLTQGVSTPAIFVVPGEDRSDHQECYYAVSHDIAIAILGAVSTAHSSWKTRLSDLLKDITQAIETDMQLGGIATWVEPEREDLYEEVNGIAVGQVLVTAHYRHSTTDPSVNAS